MARDADCRHADTKTENRRADWQTHRQHRTECDHQNDDRCEQTVCLAFRKFERCENFAAVFDLQAVDCELRFEILNLLAEIDHFLLRANRNVDHGESSFTSGINLPRRFEWARDIYTVEFCDFGEKCCHRRLDFVGGDAVLRCENDLAAVTGAI